MILEVSEYAPDRHESAGSSRGKDSLLGGGIEGILQMKPEATLITQQAQMEVCPT